MGDGSLRISQLSLDGLNPSINRLQASLRARQERFEQGCAEENILVSGNASAVEGVKLKGGQGLKDNLLGIIRADVSNLVLPLLEVLADLVLDVLLETADEQALDLVLGVVARVGHGRRFEHVHQVGEALGFAVVRRGAGQDQ